jgi:ribosome-binding factor A
MKTPIKYKDEKSASLLLKFAAEYFSIESNRDSLMTVTRTDVLDKGRRAIIFFTALPKEKENEALEFAKRRRQDFRQFVMAKKSFGFVPRIDFCIDFGEHNRQRIDELLNEAAS